MMKWLQDTYNGLVVVLIKPHLPRLAVIIALVIGVLVGLIWGYNIAPTVYYDGDPASLQQTWQDEWVKLLADRYAAPSNFDISANIVDLLSRVDDPLGIVDRLINSPAEADNVGKLQAIRPLAEAAENSAVTAPQPNDTVASLRPFILAPIILVILATVLIVLYGLLIQPIIIDPIRRSLRGEKTSKEVLEARKLQQEEQRLLQTQKTDFKATTSLGAPLMQRMTTYRDGGGDYDESYEIEENDMFLGQCGAVVSDAVDLGDGKAAAVEIWLFDKDDFVRTMTKVFVSPYAASDPTMRAQLQQKGDLVVAQPGAILTLETNSLRLQARIVELEYGVGALPPNSFFQKLSVELAAWHRQGEIVAPSPVAAPQALPVINQTPTQFAPPPTYAPPPQPQSPLPQQPSTLPTSPSSTPSLSPAQPRQAPPIPPSPLPAQQPPMRPAQTPPPPPPRVSPDEDPFGGTGDFTPIG